MDVVLAITKSRDMKVVGVVDSYLVGEDLGKVETGRVSDKKPEADAKKESQGADAFIDQVDFVILINNGTFRAALDTVIYHDWYDLIYANSLFSLYSDRCNFEDILLEMNRILRPEGAVILRDDVDIQTALNSNKKLIASVKSYGESYKVSAAKLRVILFEGIDVNNAEIY
ncbi:probable methyltransferase PMT2 [Tanacetum coccineum]